VDDERRQIAVRLLRRMAEKIGGSAKSALVGAGSSLAIESIEIAAVAASTIW